MCWSLSSSMVNKVCGTFKMSSYGINPDLQYLEFEFDGFDASGAYAAGSKSTDWPTFLLGRPLENIAAIKILEVQIPYSFYLFTAENNTFTLKEETALNSNIYTTATVTLPVGNYTSASIQPAMVTALMAASAAAGNNHTFTCTFSTLTGKLTITEPTHPNQRFYFIFGTAVDFGNDSPRLWLGFDGGESDMATGTPRTLVAPNVINLSGPNYLYLNSYSLGALCNLYLPEGSERLPAGGLGPQMAKIPCTVNPGGIVFWQDPDPQKWFDLQNVNNFAQADFYLTMGNTIAQTPLRLNGNTFSLKLGILVNSKVKSTLPGGGFNNDRVVKRFRVG